MSEVWPGGDGPPHRPPMQPPEGAALLRCTCSKVVGFTFWQTTHHADGSARRELFVAWREPMHDDGGRRVRGPREQLQGVDEILRNLRDMKLRGLWATCGNHNVAIEPKHLDGRNHKLDVHVVGTP